MPMSEEARKAASERMKKMHAEKKAKTNPQTKTPVDTQTKPTPTKNLSTLNPHMNEEPVTTEIPAPSVHEPEDREQLRQEVEMLKNLILNNPQLLQQAPPQYQQGPQVATTGMVGSIEKYIVDPAHYLNPVNRLREEPLLQRFAFKENYELDYSVETVRYQTQDNMWVREPKFRLELNRVVFDEDTGQRTNGRYTICRLIMHEDPQAALTIAREQNIPVDETNERAFLDEMRYLRFKSWLLEAFYPPKSTDKKMKREMVVDGQLVEYFEINSESSETIPFDKLSTKLKT